MQVLKLFRNILPVLAFSVAVTSCKKMLETESKDMLEAKNMYRNVFDADAAVLGTYGKFMNLAERYVVLNELRADLMTTTAGSNDHLRQINTHDVRTDNPYANPRPYYEVILNCNDVLENLNVMLRDKKLKQDEYNQRYSDIASLRSWVYLQLGIHFGKVPYVTSPFSTTAQLEAIGQMPRMEFSQLIDTLVKTVETIPYREPYAATSSLVVNAVDGYVTRKFFINKRMLLGELYLWKNDYNKAAIEFKNVMETGTGSLYNNRLTGASIGDNNDLAVWYARYRELDENMLIDNNTQGWRSIFARNDDALFNYEWIWYLPFDSRFKPTNPFISLFSNRGGSYQVKPSVVAMDSWNSQLQKNDFPFDARGKIFSYRMLDGQPVVMKYLYNYLSGPGFTPVNVFEKSGKWFLYRAASLHLYFAEAANLDKHQKLAYALVNQGLTTLPGRFNNEPSPYNFDARRTDNPTYVGDWSMNAGIRGRANMYSRPATDDSLTIENYIIEEAGLELAYEGRRWPDLLRIAVRRNDPSFLADKVYNKLVKENNPAAGMVRSKLLNKDWYLPFRWQ